MSFNCPICDKQYSKMISLSVHFRKSHKGTSKKLYVLLQYNGVEPTCSCGCGGKVKYLGITRGFRKFIQGHAARVPGKNNWGNNKKAQEKSQKTRKKMWKKGELEIWNKGLIKEEHASVAEYGRKGSETISSNQKELKRRSERMKKGRLNGTVPTLYGPKHSQWKGGISPLSHVCHGYTDFYKRWKYPLLKFAKFQCSSCGIKSGQKDNNGIRAKMEVHHPNERMADIISKFAQKFEWEHKITTSVSVENGKELHDLKLKIAKAVTEYHVINKITGVVLCLRCHNDAHKNEPSYVRPYNFQKPKSR